MVGNAFTKVRDYLKNLPWNNIFYMFYIEPIVFVLLFSHNLSGTIMKNQIIYQACTTIFNYNESDCQELGTNNISERVMHIETEVQEYVVELFMIRTILESIVPAICGIFIGSWSDHYGRKPLLLVSMIGFSFTYIISAIICQISQYYPVNPWYYILAVVPHSILGGNCVFSVAAICFLSDITTTKSRPYRMISMELYFFIGLTTGSLLSSYVYAAFGATITFSISGVLMCAATIFIALCVPESMDLKKRAELMEQEKNATTNSAAVNCDEQVICVGIVDEKLQSVEDLQISKANEEKSEADANANVEKADKEVVMEKNNDKKEDSKEHKNEENKAASLFSYVHISQMIKTCTKERPCHDRAIIWLATGTMFLSIFVFDGAMTVFYLFVREKFHWTVRDFSYYETVSHLLFMFGAVIGFLVLRKLFKMSVVTMAILAFICETIMSIGRGLAQDSWHLYISIIFGVFRNLGGPMVRTIVSNIVPPTDLGKIFSIKNVLQSLAPFLAAPLYSFIYKQSLTTFPGLFNMISAGLYATAVILLIFVLRYKFLNKKHYAEILK